MILLISNENDQTTNDVIDWLQYFNTRWERLNGEDLVDAEKHSYLLPIGADSLKLKQLHSNIDCIWFRRFYPDYSEGVGSFNGYLDDELKVLKEYILSGEVRVFGNTTHRTNKLIALSTAEELGLKIPATAIVNNKKDFCKFLDKYPSVITKPITETLDYNRGDNDYTLYTNEVSGDYLDKIPCKFFPSLIQEKVVKDFEIRTFYWKEKCYSMAIFSQENENTAIDFRRYDRKRPNRNVPYQLPDEIEEKISGLMKRIKLNSGSIDLVKDINGNFVFLEVNPNGQFGMVSYPCNYNLEMIIANDLRLEV
nr:grasp-with-spasm system ATP-grasp peptide maturase [uncultured Draconibacterium sp.]